MFDMSHHGAGYSLGDRLCFWTNHATTIVRIVHKAGLLPKPPPTSALQQHTLVAASVERTFCQWGNCLRPERTLGPLGLEETNEESIHDRSFKQYGNTSEVVFLLISKATSSNKKLLETGATLLETSALLVVTRS